MGFLKKFCHGLDKSFVMCYVMGFVMGYLRAYNIMPSPLHGIGAALSRMEENSPNSHKAKGLCWWVPYVAAFNKRK